jgi:hypothetical protein
MPISRDGTRFTGLVSLRPFFERTSFDIKRILLYFQYGTASEPDECLSHFTADRMSFRRLSNSEDSFDVTAFEERY